MTDLSLTEQKATKQSSFTRWKDTITLSAGICTMIALGIVLWSQFKPSKPAAELQILSANRLTPTIDLPDLTSNFTYAGATVRDLWKIKIRFINTGAVTIFGQGVKKNILGEGITIQFNPTLKVFGHNKYYDQKGTYIQPDGEPFPGAWLFWVGGNQLLLEFAQWRPNEEVIYTLYIASDTVENQAPLPIVPERNIIDGDLKVRDLTLIGLRQKYSLLDRLPKYLAFSGKLLGYLLSLGTVLTIVIFLTLFWVRLLTVTIWKAANKEAINEYLARPEFQLSTDQRKVIMKQPWNHTNYFGGNFPGPKPPNYNAMPDDWLGLFYVTLIGILVLFALLALTAATIYF